jgi:hypothetical protein
MLVFTVGEWVIPGIIFIPVVGTTVFTVGLVLALYLDEWLEK